MSVGKVTEHETEKEEVQDNVSNRTTDTGPPRDGDAWVPPDGGYGWLVALASFLLWFEFGHISQSGIFMLRVSPEFNATSTEFGGLNSVLGATGQLMGMFIGTLVDRVGCRPVVMIGTLLISGGYLSSAYVKTFPLLYLTYGLLPSFAVGIFYCCGVVAVNEYFVKWRAVANAIVLSGFNVASFVWPPLGSWLSNTLGWRKTFMIEAAIHFVIGSVAVMFLRPPGKKNTFCLKHPSAEQEDSKNITCKEKIFQVVNFQPLADITLDIYLLGMYFFLIGHFINVIYIPVRSELLGIDPVTAAFHATVLGAIVSVLTLTLSPIGDLKFVNRGVMFAVGNCVAAILTFISISMSTATHFYIYAALLGVIEGIYSVADLAFFIDVCGLEMLAAATGWYTVVSALAPLTLHAAVGKLLDVTGNPHSPFVLAAVSQGIGSVLFGIVAWRLYKAKHRQMQLDMVIESPKPTGIVLMSKCDVNL